MLNFMWESFTKLNNCTINDDDGLCEDFFFFFLQNHHLCHKCPYRFIPLQKFYLFIATLSLVTAYLNKASGPL